MTYIYFKVESVRSWVGQSYYYILRSCVTSVPLVRVPASTVKLINWVKLPLCDGQWNEIYLQYNKFLDVEFVLLTFQYTYSITALDNAMGLVGVWGISGMLHMPGIPYEYELWLSPQLGGWLINATYRFVVQLRSNRKKIARSACVWDCEELIILFVPELTSAFCDYFIVEKLIIHINE